MRSTPPVNSLEGHNSWEAAQLGQLILNDQRDIPYLMAPSSAIIQGESWPGVTDE